MTDITLRSTGPCLAYAAAKHRRNNINRVSSAVSAKSNIFCWTLTARYRCCVQRHCNVLAIAGFNAERDDDLTLLQLVCRKIVTSLRRLSRNSRYELRYCYVVETLDSGTLKWKSDSAQYSHGQSNRITATSRLIRAISDIIYAYLWRFTGLRDSRSARPSYGRFLRGRRYRSESRVA